MEKQNEPASALCSGDLFGEVVSQLNAIIIAYEFDTLTDRKILIAKNTLDKATNSRRLARRLTWAEAEERAMEIAALRSQGLTQQAIANRLNIRRDLVNYYLNNAKATMLASPNVPAQPRRDSATQSHE